MWRLEAHDTDEAVRAFFENFGSTAIYRELAERTVRDWVVDLMRHRITRAILDDLVALGFVGWVWTFVISA